MREQDTTSVAAVTMNSVMGDPATNLERISEWAERAHARGARFAVFPEECITGSMNKSDIPYDEARGIAQKALEISAPTIEKMCSSLDMTIAAGTIEPGEERLRNSLLVVGPEGYLGTYHKLHMPNKTEREWFEPGNELIVVRSQGWTFGIGICYDLNFPEMFRAAAGAGGEFFLLAVGNSGGAEASAKQRDRYVRLLNGSCAANALYIFYANQAGLSGKASLASLAFSCGPAGELIDCCTGKEGLVVSEVSREKVRELRSQDGEVSLKDVRPDVYSKPVVVGH